MKHTLPEPGTILYKYFSPEIAKMFLRNGLVRFTPLIEFNDPFELCVYPRSDVTMHDLGMAARDVIIEIVRNGEQLVPSSPAANVIGRFQKGLFNDCPLTIFADQLAGEIAEMFKMEDPPAIMRQYHRKYSRGVGAFCMTERFDNLLMWAHYAKDYQGVVAGFDPRLAPAAFDLMSKVSYLDEFPTRTDPYVAASIFLGRPSFMPKSRSEMMKDNVFLKSNHWKDEREWRAIRLHECDTDIHSKHYDKNKQLVKIPSEALVSIHIGCRADNDSKDEYCRLAKTMNPNVGLLKSRVSRRRFELEFLPVGEDWLTQPRDDDFEFIA